MIGLPSLRVRWVLAAAIPLFGVLWLSGCENTFEYARYPKDLAYPVRTDPIVTDTTKLPESFYSPSPGRLEEEIALLVKLSGRTKDPSVVPADQRKKLQEALNKMFGSPRLPRIGAAVGESDELVKQLTALKIRDAESDAPFKTLAHGSKVYRYHCLHCHGLTGDGRGPTGPWVVPHPRDYRAGLFKFISSKPGSNRRPRRDDLLRVLHNGIESTSMPSFALLDIRDPESKDNETDLEAAVSYVMHLSIRGSVEISVLTDLIDGTELDMDREVHDEMTRLVGEWAASNDNPITPTEGAYFEFKLSDYPNAKARDEARAKSILHGYQLFSDTKGDASCINCHSDYGRQVNFRYDSWGSMVRPMNLTTGVYRGGRRPIDLYWRIKGGIDPSTMPAATGLTNDKDVWDLVNFVHNLPYPQMLPKDVRDKVYDRPPEEHAAEERAER